MKTPERLTFFRYRRPRSRRSSAWSGRQALEIEFLKGALKNAPRSKKRDYIRHHWPPWYLRTHIRSPGR